MQTFDVTFSEQIKWRWGVETGIQKVEKRHCTEWSTVGNGSISLCISGFSVDNGNLSRTKPKGFVSDRNFVERK